MSRRKKPIRRKCPTKGIHFDTRCIKCGEIISYIYMGGPPQKICYKCK